MKSTRIITIATAITIALILSISCALPAVAETADTYDLYTVVLNCERVNADTWRVDCLAKDGNIWAFFADSDEWVVGDIAMLTLWICTADPFDDEVVNVEWLGFMELPAVVAYIESL